MKISRPKSAADKRRTLATMAQNLCHLMRKLSRELVVELRRLNSARMGDSALSRLTPRDRVRAVKAALTAHHKESGRCC
jgi:uncharacterized protein YjiS (DUF1127 family)